MSRADRARWQATRTLTDLGKVTAAWWEGTVRSLPGHRANHRPHPALAEHTTALATANRAGFLIPAAQAGFVDGRLQQRAAVQGFATDPALIRRLVDAAEEAGLEIVLNDRYDAFYFYDGPGTGIAITTGDGADNLFGQALGLPELKAMWPKLPYAVDAVASALQITLADPRFGPSTLLWDTLTAAMPAEPSPAPKIMCRECGCTFRSNCADGCIGGVWDQADGRCPACIDPSIVIDWSKNCDGEEKECALCGAPFFHAGSYCSLGCEAADGYSEEDDENDEEAAGQPSPAAARPSGSDVDDPWATGPS
ncbi:DUF6919 domain-containing protein [Streptomyces sp. NPDC001858]